MPGGRPPIPTAIKAARGTLRAHREVSSEPRAAGLPKPPKDLTPDGKREFKRLLKLLAAMNVVGAVDGMALERLVRTWLQWRVAMQMIEKTGPVIVGKDSEGKPKFRRSPYVDIAATFAAQLDKLDSGFGLTPAARSRVNVSLPAAPENNTSRFFDPPSRGLN